MQSAIVLAGFTLVSIVIIYVMITSTSQFSVNKAEVFQQKLYRDAEKVEDIAQATYVKGWTKSITKISFDENYSFKVGPNYITMSKYGEEITRVLPLNIIPAEFNASSINISYSVYNGTAAINITPA